MRVLVLAVLLAACGRSEPKQSAPDPKTGSGSETRASDAAVAPTPDATTAKSVLTPSTHQLVTAIVPDWTSTTAELRLWQREGGTWKLVMGPWPGVVGSSGSGWGSGLHGTGAPEGRDGPIKKEGDRKTPAGVFLLGDVYGYSKHLPTPIDLQYHHIEENDKCIDDPASKSYNLIVDRRTVPNDWKTAEDMRRKDNLYNWVVDVAHNKARKPGDGSCIFLHVWGGPQSVTVGCTAMEETKLVELIGTLLPAQAPAFVLLPRAEYDALAPGWGLPTGN